MSYKSETNYINRIGDYPNERVGLTTVDNPGVQRHYNSSAVRNAATNWHKADNIAQTNNDVVATGIKTAIDLGKEAADSGTKVALAGISGAKNFLKDKLNLESTSAIKSTVLGLLTAFFGVSGLKEGMDMIKNFLGGGENKTPLLFSAAKVLTASALVTGLLRTIMGYPGFLNMGSIALGSLVYLTLSMFTGSYESTNSPFAKFLEFIGLRSRVNSIMDSVGSLGTKGNKKDELR